MDPSPSTSMSTATSQQQHSAVSVKEEQEDDLEVIQDYSVNRLKKRFVYETHWDAVRQCNVTIKREVNISEVEMNEPEHNTEDSDQLSQTPKKRKKKREKMKPKPPENAIVEVVLIKEEPTDDAEPSEQQVHEMPKPCNGLPAQGPSNEHQPVERIRVSDEELRQIEEEMANNAEVVSYEDLLQMLSDAEKELLGIQMPQAEEANAPSAENAQMEIKTGNGKANIIEAADQQGEIDGNGMLIDKELAENAEEMADNAAAIRLENVQEANQNVVELEDEVMNGQEDGESSSDETIISSGGMSSSNEENMGDMADGESEAGDALFRPVSPFRVAMEGGDDELMAREKKRMDAEEVEGQVAVLVMDNELPPGLEAVEEEESNGQEEFNETESQVGGKVNNALVDEDSDASQDRASTSSVRKPAIGLTVEERTSESDSSDLDSAEEMLCDYSNDDERMQVDPRPSMSTTMDSSSQGKRATAAQCGPSEQEQANQYSNAASPGRTSDLSLAGSSDSATTRVPRRSRKPVSYAIEDLTPKRHKSPKKVNSFSCDHCWETFSHKSGLQRHMHLHSDIKKHHCSECGKQFARKDHLVSHSRQHTGERPYSCEFCPERFAHRHLQVKHYRVHHRGFKPAVTVPSARIRAPALNVNHRKENNSSQRLPKASASQHRNKKGDGFVCQECGKVTARKDNHDIHMRTHTGETPFACPRSGCDRSFKTKSHLNRHLKCVYHRNRW